MHLTKRELMEIQRVARKGYLRATTPSKKVRPPKFRDKEDQSNPERWYLEHVKSLIDANPSLVEEDL